MIDSIYNKIGSYSKNGDIFTRNIGYKLRKTIRLSDLYKRKIPSSILENDYGINLKDSKGYCSLDGLKYLEHTQDIIDITKREFSNLDVESIDWKDKDQLYTGVLNDYFIDSNSPFLKFVLQEELIFPIIKYCGFIPVLSYIGGWYSPGKKTEYSNSQLFHCDQADIRQVKVFVNCSEISEIDGPVNLIDAKNSEKIKATLNYDYSDEGQCLPDKVIEKLIPKDKWIPQIGKEGTVSLSDTSRCFHFGSRLSDNSNDRLMIMFQFLSPCAFTLPAKLNQKLPLSDISASGLNKLEKQILGVGI